jgi:hypothetical protein
MPQRTEERKSLLQKHIRSLNKYDCLIIADDWDDQVGNKPI